VDGNWDGLNVYRVSCKWEVGVRLGCLPMTWWHIDWITGSLRQLEGRVELQTGVA
jgi:hypothetical protein